MPRCCGRGRQLTEISENWRPYRTWVTLLLRTQQEIRAAGALSWG